MADQQTTNLLNVSSAAPPQSSGTINNKNNNDKTPTKMQEASPPITTLAAPQCNGTINNKNNSSKTPTKTQEASDPSTTSVNSRGTTPTKASSSQKQAVASPPPRPAAPRRPPKAHARSMSSPLARSLSARVPGEQRRWGGGLQGDSLTTTYKNDYRSPDEMSYKLLSLNLETSLKTLPDISTTYRDSYRWPPRTQRGVSPLGENISKTKNAAVNSGRGFPIRLAPAVGKPAPSSSSANQSRAENHSRVVEFCRNLHDDMASRSSAKNSVRGPLFV